MRFAGIVLIAILLPGCVTPPPSSPSEAAKGPQGWSRSITSTSFLLIPEVSDARLSYEAGNYSSGRIEVEFRGTATSIEMEAPPACEGIVGTPPPGGRSKTWWDCGPMRLEEGEIILRASGGTAEGVLSLALTRIER